MREIQPALLPRSCERHLDLRVDQSVPWPLWSLHHYQPMTRPIDLDSPVSFPGQYSNPL